MDNLFIKKIIKTFFSVPNLIFNRIQLLLFRVTYSSFKICGRLYIRNNGKLIIGDEFKANSGENCNPIGGDTILRLITGSNGVIKIGNKVGISNSTIYSLDRIEIEDGVLIGGGCRIWDTDFHSLDYKIRGTKEDIGKIKPILIKKNAFIGGGSVILRGVTVGENSIIAAGSIVTKSVPNNEIWGGNPAIKIKDINEKNIIL